MRGIGGELLDRLIPHLIAETLASPDPRDATVIAAVDPAIDRRKENSRCPRIEKQGLYGAAAWAQGAPTLCLKGVPR